MKSLAWVFVGALGIILYVNGIHLDGTVRHLGMFLIGFYLAHLESELK